jgi:3-hydroxyisobutyrate dehydrogenase-like beta-hydroxyacid dehydrogenase
MATRVGYIGVGKVGKPIAANLLKAGFPVTVFDLREEPLRELAALGARVARSPREVAEQSDIVETSVVDDAQVRQIVQDDDGILAGAAPDTILAIHSTIHPTTAVEIGELAAPHGVGVVDAPISGGVEGAEAATLLYMIGGDKALVERCWPVFSACGTTLVHLGPLGSGAMMRIVHHVILSLNRMAADEGMRLAVKYGLDPKDVQAAMHGGEGQSHVTDGYLEKYETMPTGGQCRVAGMALAMANAKGATLPALALFQQLYLAGPITLDQFRQ